MLEYALRFVTRRNTISSRDRSLDVGASHTLIMRDKKAKGGRHSKDDYESAIHDDMEAEAAYERQKAAWKEAPDAKPAARPTKEAPKIAVDESVLSVLTDSDHSKRAQLTLDLLEAMPASVRDGPGYAELRARLSGVSTANIDLTDTAGNDLPGPEVELRLATRAELKKIRKKVDAKREAGEDCDTDDELEAIGLRNNLAYEKGKEKKKAKPPAKAKAAPAKQPPVATPPPAANGEKSPASASKKRLSSFLPGSKKKLNVDSPANGTEVKVERQSSGKKEKKGQDCVVM